MRIAIIADTHLAGAELRLPERCLEELRGADAILHAGDISSVAALAALSRLGPPVHAVAGNVEEPELRRLLPETLELRLGEVSLAMIHDAGAARGRAERMHARFPDADAVLFGHSHLPLLEGASPLIFNPGSPTQRRRSPHRSMGIAELARGHSRFTHVRL